MIPTLLFVLAQIPIVPFEHWDEGQASPCLPYNPQNSIEWPADPQFGTADGFGRIVIGDLDGDQTADGVVLADGVAVVLWNITIHSAPVLIEFPPGQSPPVAVSDVAILRGGGNDGRDALVMSDERGLYLVTYDDGAFSAPDVLAGTALAFAHPIHVDHLDAGGEADILALGADMRTVYKSMNSGGTFTTTVLVVEPYDTFDMVAVNWDQTGDRELVAVTRRGVIAHTLGGTYLGGAIHHATWGCITRLETSGVAGGEILAWARPLSATVSQLVLKSATTIEGPWEIKFDVCGTEKFIHPSAILAGRYDEDANDDLLIAHEDAPTAFMLANTGTAGTHFDFQDPYKHDVFALIDGSVTGQGGIGIPAFTQVDLADSDDLVFPVSVSNQVDVFLFYPFERALIGAATTSADIVSDRTEFGPEDGKNRLRLAFEVPVAFHNFKYIEVKVWRQDPQDEYVFPNALAFKGIRLLQDPEGEVSPVRQWITVVPDFGSAVDCWDESTKPNYYLEFRFSKQNANGSWSRSRFFPGGFTMEDCDGDTNYGDLQFLVVPGASSFPLYDDNGLRPDPPESLDRNQLGLYVPMNSEPPFEPGITPTFPNLELLGTFAHPFATE
jgi:hypothetical protein